VRSVGVPPELVQQRRRPRDVLAHERLRGLAVPTRDRLGDALVSVGVDGEEVVAVERLFGFIGLMVAVPILVTVKILVEELWVLPLETAHGGREPPDEAPPAAGRWRMRRARRPVETGPAD
jgi:hypothetical protein